MNRIVLASASPRRADLLRSAQIAFSVVRGEMAEARHPREAPAAYVRRLAAAKARDAAGRASGRFFIGADTVVVLDGEIIGKPRDDRDAARMLRRLSGRVHHVFTGYAVYDRERGRTEDGVVVTDVEFKALNGAEIAAYVASGDPGDKAGAYAIQGRAAAFVRRIAGSYTNVVGLPLCEVVEALAHMGALESARSPALAKPATRRDPATR